MPRNTQTHTKTQKWMAAKLGGIERIPQYESPVPKGEFSMLDKSMPAMTGTGRQSGLEGGGGGKGSWKGVGKVTRGRREEETEKRKRKKRRRE